MTEEKQKCSFCAAHNVEANTICPGTELDAHTDEDMKLWIWTGESMAYVYEDDDLTGRYYPRYCPECGRRLN